MKVALFVGLTIFCSLWAIGSFDFLQCSHCQSAVSYEDCQDKIVVKNCSGSHATEACFQADVKWEKGSDKVHQFAKGCVGKEHCGNYEKGKFGDCESKEGAGYTVDCKAKCCHEDECNKRDLLPSEGSAFVISAFMLLSGLLLTLVNIN